MKVVIFMNQLGIGGTEKAACRWARGLVERGHEIYALTMEDGPRRVELESNNIQVRVAATNANIQKHLVEISPDVIHVHAPGHPHSGDILGQALATMPKKIPVVQTNVFGRFDNPKENSWTDFRLFISWTSCVQAARRSFRPMNEAFFKHASVAVYPVDPDDGPKPSETKQFRQAHGAQADEILLGRLSRPEPNKWTDLPIAAFRLASKRNPRLKLLLREPPPAVADALKNAVDRHRFIILPTTANQAELAVTTASFDVVLHTSVTGESFGYGIAEPMNYGKPVITNSTPWLDQAQIELVRQGESGFIASTPESMANAMLALAGDSNLRTTMGRSGQVHIRQLADPTESIDRLETALETAISGKENPLIDVDLAKARTAASALDKEQFGHSFKEQVALRPPYYRTRFQEWLRSFSRRC